MAKLALVSNREATLPPAEWAHDVRNLLAAIGLHLDTLARLSGPSGAKAANAVHGLVVKVSGMCNDAVTGAAGRSRMPFDITATIRQAVDLVAPLGPPDFIINVVNTGSHVVRGDQTEVFRVLFNLLYNAQAVARSSGVLRRVDISLARVGDVTTVKIADDGGGLPPEVAADLFRRPAAAGAVHGHGLAIARELMERNGGTLACDTSAKGTVFRLELPTCTRIRAAEGPLTRSLGRRATR